MSENPFTPDDVPPCVIDAVAALPEIERRVITLRLGFDRDKGSVPYGDIAKQLQCRDVVVRGHERLALIKLREMLPLELYVPLQRTLGRWFGRDKVAVPDSQQVV